MGEAAKKGTGDKHQRGCINIGEGFPRHRIFWEANGATRGQWPRSEWPWLMELHGRHSVISPWGGDVLQAWTDRPRIGAQLRRLPFVLHATGDDETVIRFHIDDAAAVFAILGPYRRRQLSAAERERRAAVLVYARRARGSDFCEAAPSQP